MPCVYKTIRIKKKGGGSRLQRVQVLASGKYRFVKNIGSRVKKLTKRSKKVTRRKGSNPMARRKRGRRGSRKFTLPLAPIIGLGVGIVPAAAVALEGDYDGAINKLKWAYLGLSHDNKFKPEGLMEGLVPLVVGGLVHKFVGGAPLNLNRMLAKANVPVIRI